MRPFGNQQPAGASADNGADASQYQYRLDQPLPTQVSAPAPTVKAGEKRPGELMIARIRQHARGVLLPSIACIIGAGLIGYSTQEWREAGSGLPFFLGGLVLVVILGLLPIGVWLRHRYSITSVRTTRRGGVRNGQASELLHHQVASVTVRQNGWQRLFGSGTVRLTGFDGRVLELRDVPNVVTVSKALRELAGVNGE